MINKEGWRTTGKSLQILSGCANKAHIYYVFTYVLLFKVFGSFLMWDTRKGELKLRESVIVDSSWMEKFHTEYDLGVTPEDAAGFLGWRLLRGELVFHLESNCMVWKAVEGIAKKKKKKISQSHFHLSWPSEMSKHPRKRKWTISEAETDPRWVFLNLVFSLSSS